MQFTVAGALSVFRVSHGKGHDDKAASKPLTNASNSSNSFANFG
jgi:hypothetical protein